MTCLIALTSILALGMAEPGPLDAYKMNFRDIKATTKFSYNKYIIQDHPAKQFTKDSQSFNTSKPSKLQIDGKWECDGTTEHWILHSENAKQTIGDRAELPDFEGLYNHDTRTFAHHNFADRQQFMFIKDTDKPPFNVIGATDWMGLPFLAMLDDEYKSAILSTTKIVYRGNPAVLEAYKLQNGKEVTLLSVIYDPAIGYLPRYIRGVAYDSSLQLSAITSKEIYVLNARPCDAGGFVPTEWIQTFFNARDFDTQNLNDFDVSFKTTSNVEVDHYKTTKFDSLRTDTVGMSEISMVERLASRYGDTAIPKNTSFLNLQQLQTLIGGKLRKPKLPAIPNTKTPDLSLVPMNEPIKTIRTEIKNIGIVVILLITSFSFGYFGFRVLKRNRKKSFIWLMICTATSGSSLFGCSPGTSDSPKSTLSPILEANTEVSSIIYNNSDKIIDIPLKITNTSDQTQVILSADGGCTCRKFDTSQFPLTIKPLASGKLVVQYSPKVRSSAQTIPITLTLSIGKVVCPLKISAFPRHVLSPDTFSTSWYSNETQELSFEMTHREIYHDSGSFTETIIETSDPALSASRVTSEIGVLPDQERLKFRDTIYKLTLSPSQLKRTEDLSTQNALINKNLKNSQSVSSQTNIDKISVALKQLSSSKILAEANMLTQSHSFLSTSPERILIGDRPVRIFLRCPDDSIEFTRITSKSSNITGVIVSPREIVFNLTKNALPTFDELITIDTNYTSNPQIIVQARRYSIPK